MRRKRPTHWRKVRWRMKVRRNPVRLTAVQLYVIEIDQVLLGAFFFIYKSFHKQLSDRGLFKWVDAQDLQHFMQTMSQVELFLKDGHQQISANGRPQLALHSVGTVAHKSANTQMLLDP